MADKMDVTPRKGGGKKKAESEKKEEKKSQKLDDIGSISIPTVGAKQKPGFNVPSISSSQKMRESISKHIISQINDR